MMDNKRRYGGKKTLFFLMLTRLHVRYYKRLPRQIRSQPSPPSSPSTPRWVYVLGGYAALINVGSFGLFAYDKFQASHRGW
jgi:hypothetical protein